MKREKALRLLQNNRAALASRYHIASLSIFGSVARDEARDSSDIDVLVEFSKTPGLFEFIALQQELENLLGCKVDIGTPRSLKPHIKPTAIKEAIRAP